MAVKLTEVAPGKWRIDKKQTAPARSDLAVPYVISDIMEPTDQVDGRFDTSKATFRAVGKAHGLTEVGNEKFRPKERATASRKEKETRRATLKKALERYKAGHRAKRE